MEGQEPLEDALEEDVTRIRKIKIVNCKFGFRRRLKKIFFFT